MKIQVPVNIEQINLRQLLALSALLRFEKIHKASSEQSTEAHEALCVLLNISKTFGKSLTLAEYKEIIKSVHNELLVSFYEYYQKRFIEPLKRKRVFVHVGGISFFGFKLGGKKSFRFVPPHSLPVALMLKYHRYFEKVIENPKDFSDIINIIPEVLALSYWGMFEKMQELGQINTYAIEQKKIWFEDIPATDAIDGFAFFLSFQGGSLKRKAYLHFLREIRARVQKVSFPKNTDGAVL